MKLILIGVILITLFTNTIMAKNNKNINYKSAMTSNEAYTYTPKKEKSIWDTIFDMQKKGSKHYKKIKIKLFSKGGKVK